MTPADGAMRVLVLPPIRRGSGAAESVWGALLAHQVLPEIRIILPQDGVETRRLCGLVHAVRIPEVLRLEPLRPLDELIREAAAIAFMPSNPVGAYIEVARAAEIAPERLILHDIPVMRQRLGTAGERVHWCAHRTPREVARQILRVLEPAAAAPRA